MPMRWDIVVTYSMDNDGGEVFRSVTCSESILNDHIGVHRVKGFHTLDVFTYLSAINAMLALWHALLNLVELYRSYRIYREVKRQVTLN